MQKQKGIVTPTAIQIQGIPVALALKIRLLSLLSVFSDFLVVT